ncbi:sugar transferase [Spirosoma spitsbergense]|uniref:sugar transferase n=1 Tax=Spirosoma spitsbergense TaxID=431554 RepID=UPI000370426B|nr:sugar transferase [Spirosoma spitsbergense]
MSIRQQSINPETTFIPEQAIPAFCILLVMDDDILANRIATIAGKNCSVVRFRNEADSDKWLTDKQQVNLIILDKTTGPTMVANVRRKADYQLVPVLVTCRFGENHLVRKTLAAGVTDMLVINEENYSIQTKIDYYLSLCNQVQTFQPVEQQPPVYEYQYSTPRWKRSIDIFVSLLILVLLSPIMLLVALLIRIDSKGPVIYKSKRAGANFHVFNMYKFRTMEVDADQLINQLSAHNLYAETTHESADIGTDLCPACSELGITCQQILIDHNKSICEKAYLSGAEKSAKFMKFRNDPRVTRLGTFLRNSSIDELPQLVNILVGDMSLVGNRPLPLYEAEKLTSNEFAQRFCGPAGLTGLWQIKKRAKGQGMMSDRERTLLDIDYTNNFSFNTDIQIIWKTFFSLWQKENV